ncbi:uncharacterized protein LOC106636178 [Copidosoma floridanum]|uniref:uncharacterized protein LOC106636178 n=1 Tax=Copidosoma floridanum TaxID=29053 RepID=UPI0006C95122|nr:uncharacterized protein LOC106636178 [Copidosoma floridanum]
MAPTHIARTSVDEARKAPRDTNDLALESPFVWGIDASLAASYEEEQELEVGFDEQPVVAIVQAAVMVYINATQRKLDRAQERARLADQCLVKLDRQQVARQGISPTVLEHIVEATRCHLSRIIQLHRSTPAIDKWECDDAAARPREQELVARATLAGCKSVAWSMFHEEELDRATALAREAVRASPACPLWHFVLGKNLRRLRRRDGPSFEPGREERVHLAMAYDLSGEPFYGVFAALMHRESREFERAAQLYLGAFARGSKSVGINLRLALGFVRIPGYLHLAQACLERVRELAPGNSMYLHYRGIYCERLGLYKLASTYFYEAAKCGNGKAEMQYVDMMAKLLPQFDCVGYFKGMVRKYENDVYLQQLLLLNVAVQYFFKGKDVKNALVYFSKAIRINPRGGHLQKFYDGMITRRSYNIFKLVREEVLPEFDRIYLQVPEDLKDIHGYLNNLTSIKKWDKNELTKHSRNMKLQNVC